MPCSLPLVGAALRGGGENSDAIAARLTETPVDCGCDGPVLLVDAVTAATVVIDSGEELADAPASVARSVATVLIGLADTPTSVACPIMPPPL